VAGGRTVVEVGGVVSGGAHYVGQGGGSDGGARRIGRGHIRPEARRTGLQRLGFSV